MFLTVNPLVVGSSPTPGANPCDTRLFRHHLRIDAVRSTLEQPRTGGPQATIWLVACIGNDQESGLAEVHRFPDQRREFIADGDHSALRATWHYEAGYFVISLWRDETCVATSHLTPREAGRLATFITGGLADLAHEGISSESVVTPLSLRSVWRHRVRLGVRHWRESVGFSLGRIANRLRSGN